MTFALANFWVYRSSLSEDAPEIERNVAGVGDGSPVAAVGVEVVHESALLHELLTIVIIVVIQKPTGTAAPAVASFLWCTRVV